MSNQSNPSNPSNRTPLGRALSRCVLMVATLLLLGSTTGSFAQGPAGRGIDERHDRVVREVERTQQLWDEVNGRVERTSAANLFQGRLARVIKGRLTTEYVVQLGDGTEICSLVTEESRSRLDLEENDQVWVMFNAFSVILNVN